MSLILDALHKADQERNNNPLTNAVDTPQAPAYNPVESRPLGLLVGLVVVFIVVAVALFLLFFQEKPDNNDKAIVNANENNPPAETLVPLSNKEVVINDVHDNGKRVVSDQVKGSEEVLIKQSDDAMAKRIAAQYESVSTKADQQLKNNKKTTVKTAHTKTVDPVASLYSKQTVPGNRPGSVKNVQDTIAQYADLGVIRDLPLSVQNNIPTLMYASHEYSSSGKSYIVINNQKFNEGNTIVAECVLEKILSDGIIVSYGSHRFILKALNSWVNM